MVLVGLVSVAAAEPKQPRVRSTVLTLQRGTQKPARLIIKTADVLQTRALEPCPVTLTFAPQHAQFRSFEAKFTYRTSARAQRHLSVTLDATPVRGDLVSIEKAGHADVTLKARRLTTKLDARFDH